MVNGWKNKLFFGDNLDILREYIPDESVDLIYLDPPFNSKATYNVLFKEKNGSKSAAQIKAFDDTWHWGLESERAYHEVVTEGPKKLADLLQALRQFLGTNDMMAYLTMMAIRLVELHRVLKSTGTIYLHCDPTASHYLKLVMDAIFGPYNFRNEIIWGYSGGGIGTKDFPRKHDVILRYSKGEQRTYHPIYKPYTSGTRQRGRTRVKGPYAKLRPEGTPIPDWWFSNLECDKCGHKLAGNIKRLASPTDPEKLGYPTQKPEDLLERIIKASSNEGDLVLDPFCGCGTTIVVAERLHRRWIGIDITHIAITLMRHRLHSTFGEELSPYEVIGDPKDPASARALAQEDRYQFQLWSLGLVEARPSQEKRGADTGIDGYIYFFDDPSGKPKKIVVQVKSGHVGVSQIRDLKGVMERENAVIGVFITLEEPTRPMRIEAVAAGFYEPEYWPGEKYPHLQILTIEELLNGKTVQYPRKA
ncbi:MAG: site-specific DNA-methyltransferase, partial [Thermotogae bacterium]